jgi:tetratricopeptide (TPR) repeat protein
LATLLPLALALAGLWFAGSWYLGDTIAENLDPDNRGLENARLAVNLAPGDPLAHWRLAELELKTLPPDQLTQAIAEYEQATRLAPNDYRYWLALGRALEQSGDAEKGAEAMRRAVDLAPAYSFPRWYLGNLLLRSGNYPAAFAELRRASEANPELRGQVFSLAWQVYGQSPAELASVIGPQVPVRAEFARYLIDSGQLDAGLEIWNSLKPNEKKESKEAGQAISKSLREAKRFRLASELWNDLAADGAERSVVGQVIDGGCEQNKSAEGSPFGWQLNSSRQAQASFDSLRPHSGERSVRIVFKATAKVDFNVSQMVIVEPGTQYDLSCFERSLQLVSAGLPVVEVIDAGEGTVLGVSKPAPSDDSAWQPLTISFKTGAKTEAIVIRINRASCGDNPECPIFGTVWYDDFSLKKHG